MNAETITKQLVQLEQEHQNAIANVLRLEGAIAILRQMLSSAKEENTLQNVEIKEDQNN